MARPKGSKNLRPKTEIIGRTFGMLTVVALAGYTEESTTHARRLVQCRCVCGNLIVRRWENVCHNSRIANASCGCVRGSKPKVEGIEAAEHPTTWDIAWAAGLYEGEGNFAFSGNAKRGRVVITQKDCWVLERMRELFGGNVRERRTGKFTVSDWCISGPRANGFLMTIWKFLSPRRKEQIFSATNAKGLPFRFRRLDQLVL